MASAVPGRSVLTVPVLPGTGVTANTVAERPAGSAALVSVTEDSTDELIGHPIVRVQ